jgi:hypothetical protein
MIISASRRTDLPAFYTPWLLNRLRAGEVSLVNPYNRRQVSRIALQPDTVAVIVFWTKNPAPLLPYLAEIDRMGFKYYFQFTLNDYPKVLEPGVPPLRERLTTFKRLTDLIGKERVIWRYDPILFTERTDFAYHRKRFAALLAELAPNAGRIVTSIADDYRGAGRRLARLASSQGYTPIAQPQLSPEYGGLFQEMADRAAAAGLRIYSCAEPFDLRPFGIQPGKCIDNEYIQQVFGITVSARKDPSQRRECGCVISRDIGFYDSCLHDCVYCYATRNPRAARENYRRHRPEAPSLLGGAEPLPSNSTQTAETQFELFD